MNKKGKFITVRGRLLKDRIYAHTGGIYLLENPTIYADSIGYFLLYQEPLKYRYTIIQQIFINTN